jgi:glycosyltransferase involved in cell wall biosynthesis
MENPFVLAMGSAHRDYASLLDAVRRLGVRTVIVASPRALDGLVFPSNVEIRTGLSLQQCRELANQARISVVPLFETDVAAGQVTVLDSMNLGKPVIATRCMGTEDYIRHGESGLLVPPRSADHLAEAIDLLWRDQSLRSALGAAAAAQVAREYSDEVAGAALGRIVSELS